MSASTPCITDAIVAPTEAPPRRLLPIPVLDPRWRTTLEKRAQSFLRLGAHALRCDATCRVPARRLVRQSAHLADDGLRCTRGRRSGSKHIADGGLHRGVERRNPLHD